MLGLLSNLTLLTCTLSLAFELGTFGNRITPSYTPSPQSGFFSKQRHVQMMCSMARPDNKERGT